MSDDDTRQGRIFRLSARDLPKSASLLKSLEQRWWGLSTTGSLPMRRHVTAGMIGDALPHAFIAERVAPGHARLRVAGRKLSDLVGTEARGMPLSCLIETQSRSLLSQRLEHVFSRPAIVDIPVFAPRGLGLSALRGRLLMLPLEGDDGTVDRMLGALMLDGAISRRPRRLQIDDAAEWRCDPFERKSPKESLQAMNGDLPRLAPRPPAGKVQLRLVVDNDA